MDQKQLPDKYPLPDGFKGIPYEYQYQGAAFLYAVKKGLLGDATGAGKTIEALLACALIKNKKISNPKVLIVTVNSAVYQWKSEIKRFIAGWRPIAITSEYLPDQRREIGRGIKGNDIFIMGYSLLRNDTSSIRIKGKKLVKRVGWIDKIPWDIIIFDEAATFKNYKTQVFTAAKLVADRAKYVWALTAYAMSNNPLEVFGIYSVLTPGLFGISYEDRDGNVKKHLGVTRFRNTYTVQREIRVKGGKIMRVYVRGKNLDILKDKISSAYVGRNYAELGKQLPGLIEKRVTIQLGKMQRKAYDLVENDLLGKVKIEETLGIKKVTEMPGPQNVLVRMLHLQKITNGLQFWNSGIDSKCDENPKADEIVRLLEDEFINEKVVIFSKFRSYIDLLEQNLGAFHPVRITGTEDQKQREVNKQLFSDPKSKHRVLLMTRAGQMGLNLQAARVIVLVDSPFSYGELGQVIGRVRRIGSEHTHCIIVYMIAEDTFDTHVIDILKGKKKTIEAVFGEKDLLSDVTDYKMSLEEHGAHVKEGNWEAILLRRIKEQG